MVQLHTLGDAVIRVGDREVRPTSPHVFAALLYLGVERGQRVPRAALQELLFPDADERSGAHSVRQLLYKLRQLGVPVVTEGDCVSLSADAVVDDYSAPGVATNGTKHAANGSARLLPGYAPGISSAFDEWLEEKRGAMAAGVRRWLVAQMSARRDAADWAGVEHLARQLLENDPFNEEATLALAEAAALSGAKAEAISILERYEAETGRSDLKLPAAVLRRRISERLPERRHRKMNPPFVGRESESAQLREAIRQAKAGTATSAVIVGEPGIGKTRLVEEACALATLEGMGVHVVRCRPHHVNRPMGVFIELIPSLLTERGALGVSPESMAQLKLLTSHSDSRADQLGDARDNAIRSGIVLAAFRDLLDAVTAETPLFVAVEDVQWADAASLAELDAVMSGNASRSLLVVHTTRSTEVFRKSSHGVSDSTPVLRLGKLADGAMRTLANAFLAAMPSGASDELGAWCVRTAGGNPLYLQMLFAYYEETRQPFVVPPSIRAATTRRIEQLPGLHRRLLELVVLLGRHATLDALQVLASMAPLDFVDAIQRLEEEGYIRATDAVLGPSHELVGEETLALLAPLTVKALHSLVAASLEQRYEQTAESTLLWDCANHWAESGESSKALQFLLRCARHATEIGRAAQACELLEEARKHALHPKEKRELLEATIRAAKAAGDWKLMLEASLECQTVMDHAAGPQRHSDVELLEIESRWVLSKELGAREEQLRACVQDPSASNDHRIYAAQMAIRVAHERLDAGLAKVAWAAAQPLLTGNDTYAAKLLPIIYHTSFGDRGVARGLAVSLGKAIDRIESGDQFRAYHNVGTALAVVGQWEDGRDLFIASLRKATGLDLPLCIAEAACNLCWLHTFLDDLGEAETWHGLAVDAAARSKGTVSHVSHLVHGLELAIRKGDPALAWTRFAEVTPVSVGDSRRRVSFLAFCRVRIQQIDPSFVCDSGSIQTLQREFELSQRFMGADPYAVALADALVRVGRLADASSLLERYVNECRRELMPIPKALQSHLSALGIRVDQKGSNRGIEASAHSGA